MAKRKGQTFQFLLRIHRLLVEHRAQDSHSDRRKMPQILRCYPKLENDMNPHPPRCAKAAQKTSSCSAGYPRRESLYNGAGIHANNWSSQPFHATHATKGHTIQTQLVDCKAQHFPPPLQTLCITTSHRYTSLLRCKLGVRNWSCHRQQVESLEAAHRLKLR